MKKAFLFLLLILLLPIAVNAHQPRYVETQTAIQVIEPEISKAYYGQLTGEAVTYTINSDKDFKLYVNLLVPQTPEAKPNISATILRENSLVAKLDGKAFQWIEYYEEFAGDDYLKGPEFSQEVPAGEYQITVSSPDNQGPYVIAIGDIESFPLQEIVSATQSLPQIKREFFHKSAWSILNSRIGEFMSMAIVAFIIIILAIVFIIKRLKMRLKKK